MAGMEIVDAISFSYGFPSPPQREIPREHILETMELVLDTKVEALLIEGEEGTGKSILLSQFVRRNRQNTISLFLRPASRAAIDPAYIASVLGEQIYWLLHGEALHQELVTDADLRSYFAALNRKYARGSKRVYFVVDGLEDSALPEHVSDIIIRELLPFGLPTYKFLIAGSVDSVGKKLHRSIVSRPFTVPLCSLDDALRYLEDLALSRTNIEELYRLCRRNFGRLATVRRLIQLGESPETLLDESPPDFMGLEWKAIANGSKEILSVVRTLAFAQGSYTAESLSRITHFSKEAIDNAIRSTDFLTVAESTGDVTICSAIHRKFAQRQLSAHRDEILDSLIKFHGSSDSTDATDLQLPHYFNEANRYGDLVNYLNTGHFVKLAQRTQSLTPVRSGTTLGLRASIAAEDFPSILRFSAQSGLLAELSAGDVSRAEIEARVQLGDEKRALALAERASLKESRLQLLAATVSALKKYQNKTDPTLVAQINALIDQVDLLSMGERAIDVASDLVAVDPDLALRVVQSSAQSNSVDASVDEAFAKYALLAIRKNKDKPAAQTAAAQARERMADPHLQSFVTSLSLFLGSASAKDVIAHAESFDITRALFFLRSWTKVTNTYNEAALVLNYGLDLLIRNASYTPQVRDLRELATPLRHIPDDDARRGLINRFDSQRSTVLDLGTNEDLVRLQLYLAEGEAITEPAKAHDRLLELYWQVCEVKDLSTRASCLSWIVSHYKNIDLDHSLESREGLLSVVQKELGDALSALLNTTADHLEVAKGALQALARNSASKAIELAAQLNTQIRRDGAYLEVVRAACQPKLDLDCVPVLLGAIRKITERTSRDSAISVLVGESVKGLRNVERALAPLLPLLIDLSKEVTSSTVRARTFASLYDCLRKRPDEDALQSLGAVLLSEMRKAWNAIDAEWRKANLGFQIAKQIGGGDKEAASDYVAQAELVQTGADIVSEGQFDLYVALVRLTIRAFAGLLPRKLEDPSNLDALKKIIDCIPARAERAKLWAELACRAYLADRKEVCEAVVSKYVRPQLELISVDNIAIRLNAAIYVAPALFCAHQTTAMDLIAKLPAADREEAAFSVAMFLLRQAPIGDAYVDRRSKSSRVKHKHQDIVSIFVLINLLSTDSAIFYLVIQIANYAASKLGKGELTRQHVADIAARIETDVLPKLPDQKNIRHDGYVIACRVQVLRLRNDPMPKWEPLILAARSIPNIADRSFVLLLIAAAIAPRYDKTAHDIFVEARALIDKIPVAIDRLDRLETMAEEIVEINPALAKECIKSAYRVACSGKPNEDLATRRRALLDLAHSIGASFAEELVAIIDDDPVRVGMKREANERLRTLEMEKGFTDKEADLEEMRKNRSEFTEAAWRALGLLNAGWEEPAHIEAIWPVLEKCGDLPLLESSYPILSWAVENLIRRVSKGPSAGQTILPMFNALVQVAECAINIIGKTNGNNSDVLKRFDVIGRGGTEDSVVIEPGERERGLKYIEAWITAEVGSYLKICDQYFGVNDLELIRFVRGLKPDCKIVIVTSKKQQPKGGDLEEVYSREWTQSISPRLPGGCEIVIVGIEGSGESPIHDRWWITEKSGLRLGTSYNSMGISKASEIAVLHEDEIAEREAKVDSLIQRTTKEHKGGRISFTIFDL